MRPADLLIDAVGRVREVLRAAVQDLTPEQLAWRADPRSNTVGWLAWHLTRVQDDHVAEVAGTEQVWTAGGWQQRLGLDLAPGDIGYGHSSAQVAAVRIEDPTLLLTYHDAVHEATVRYLDGLTADDLDRVVDERWDPPVTLGVRLVSVVSDDLQHAGQAAFLRGLLERAGDG